MSGLNYLALDLGAESGRAMLGQFDGERLQITEAHRFANMPVRLPDGLHTDVLRIWAEINQGMIQAARTCGGALAGIGVDTWGVDFAFLDRQGGLLANPYQYRDRMTDGILEKAFAIVPRQQIFEQTGIQFMQINSLYQLLALKLGGSPLLDAASQLLMIPDLFNYWLSGSALAEFSIATTSQCYDPRRADWARPLLAAFGLRADLFPRVVPPGTVLGSLNPALSEDTGLAKGVPVIAPGGHDTALAVAAVPARSKDFAYISSGTWSLLGAELNEPCINAKSLERNFTNEGGVGQTYRFLKNLTGLWLVQECKRSWARRGEDLSYGDLTAMAADAAPLRSLVNGDSPEFAPPGKMPERIQEYCQRSGQPVPETKGEIVRCALQSLALSYRWALAQLEDVLGRRLDPIHIVGGGTQNKLLNQLAADATGRQVVTGPVEATVVGNVLMQAVALGHLASLDELRAVVRRSFEVSTYEPVHTQAWEDAYVKYLKLKENA
jgi:rhamnulokinase